MSVSSGVSESTLERISPQKTHLTFQPCFLLLENYSAIEHMQITGHANFYNGSKMRNAESISDSAANLDFKQEPLLFNPLKSEQ